MIVELNNEDVFVEENGTMTYRVVAGEGPQQSQMLVAEEQNTKKQQQR